MPPIQYRLSASRGLRAMACSKHAIAASGSFELEVNLAELMAQRAVLRPFADQSPATVALAMMYCLVAISA